MQESLCGQVCGMKGPACGFTNLRFSGTSVNLMRLYKKKIKFKIDATRKRMAHRQLEVGYDVFYSRILRLMT